MKQVILKCCAAAALVATLMPASAKKEEFRYMADWDQIRTHYKCPEWFKDAKFGIFIHWGPYAVPAFGGEKYPKFMYYEGKGNRSIDYYQYHLEHYKPHNEFGYKDFIPMFKAEKFDAELWAKIFKDSGAKYVVPVAEHHDSFAMYDSQFTEWNSVNMGPKRDVLREIMDACHKQGLKCGASSHLANWKGYYVKKPQFDTSDPAYAGLYWKPEQKDTYSQDFMDMWWNRTTDIIDNYKPDILWFDFCSDRPAFNAYHKQMLAYYYNMGLREGKEVVFQDKNMNQVSYPEDLIVLDIERGRSDRILDFPWQTDTSVSKTSWGYIKNSPYKTSGYLIDELIDITSKNGCLLLNIDPKADGTIPAETQSILADMGAWLDKNGEAIYETRPWTIFGEGPTKVSGGTHHSESENAENVAEDFRFTTKGATLYAIAMAWDEKGEFCIKSLAEGNEYAPAAVKRVKLLSGKNKLSWEQTKDGLKIKVEGEKPCEAAYAFKVTF